MPAPSSLPISSALSHLTELSCTSSLVTVAEHASLLDRLRLIPDPRDPRGIRHTLVSVLAVAATAVLAGARSFTAIGEWINDAPAQVMTALEVRRDQLNGVHRPPHEATVRRVLESVDAKALDTAITTWLSARLRAQTASCRHRAITSGDVERSPWTARHCAALAAASTAPCTCWRRWITTLAWSWPRPTLTARPTRSPGSGPCWKTLTWMDASSPPTPCTPSAITPPSW